MLELSRRVCPCSSLMPHMELDDAGTALTGKSGSWGLARWSVRVRGPTHGPSLRRERKVLQ